MRYFIQSRYHGGIHTLSAQKMFKNFCFKTQQAAIKLNMSMTVNLELYELLFGDFFICNIKLNILTLLNCAIQ